MLFFLDYLQISQKYVPLQCVFHSIRFKVNKGWSKALLLFLCPIVRIPLIFSNFAKERGTKANFSLDKENQKVLFLRYI